MHSVLFTKTAIQKYKTCHYAAIQLLVVYHVARWLFTIKLHVCTFLIWNSTTPTAVATLGTIVHATESSLY